MALEDCRSYAGRCSGCSACKWVPYAHIKSWRFAKGCPSIAYNNFQAYSAKGRLAVALSLIEGRSGYTDGFLDIVYKCLTCGLCDVACKVSRYNMEPLETIQELKLRSVEDGQLLPHHLPIIDNLRKEDTTLVGKLKASRGDWAKGLKVKDLTKEKAEVIFHAGCRFSYDDGLQKIARTAVMVLQEAGVDVGIMGKDESCCGGRVYTMGYRGEFIKYAENNIGSWTNAGVKTVVTSCADGYWAIKRLYPMVGSKFEVLHTVEYVDRLIKQGKIKFTKSIPMTVSYHDPCHLGRQGEPSVPWKGKEKKIYGQMIVYEPRKPRYDGSKGIYDPPRDLLKAIPGIKLVEMERIREYAWCCGAGGGCSDAYPEFSNWTAQERIEEARATGSEALVTACPGCEANFLANLNGNNMKVLDIIELVKQAI